MAAVDDCLGKWSVGVWREHLMKLGFLNGGNDEVGNLGLIREFVHEVEVAMDTYFGTEMGITESDQCFTHSSVCVFVCVDDREWGDALWY